LSIEEEPWIRHALLEALGELDAAGNREAIASYLGHDDPTLRARAAEYLQEVLSPEIEEAMVRAYGGESVWWVKTALLEALGAGTSDDSLGVLHDGLKDKSRDVRAAATCGLGLRADPRSVALLAEALERGDLIGTDSPVWALGRIGDRSAAPALEVAAFLPYPIVRKGAAWALGEVGEPDSERVLAQLLDDPDGMVRTEAAEALGELGGVRAALDLLSVLEHSWSDRVYYAMLHISEEDLSAACEQFLAEQTAERKALKARRKLCEQTLEEAGGEEVWFWSSGELHSTFYSPANAKAREVWPGKGRKAVGWEDAIGKELGGSRLKLDKGTRLTIWKAAFYGGETWLEVAAGPYGGHVWIREVDVRPIDPESLREVPIWTNYGADTRGYLKKE
jgi:HEAT repeat protein